MQFDLIVEGPPGGPDGDFRELSPHALVLERLVWDGDAPPDLIVMEQGTVLVKIARYAMPGNKYRYHVATSASLIGGTLQENTNAL